MINADGSAKKAVQGHRTSKEQASVLVSQRAQSFPAVLLNIVLSHGIKGFLPSTNPSMKDNH